MSGRNLAATAVLVLAVAAPQLGAEDAKHRGGGSSSSGSSHASHGNSGGGSSGSGYHPSGSSGGQSSSGGSVGLSDAQRRHPRAGTGTGYRSNGGYYGGGYHGGYYGGGYYGGGYYRPYYSRPYSWGYGSYPWGGLYFDSYYGGGPTYYGGTYVRPYGDSGSVRIMVDKEKAKVYVDGYYAGVVDDFDGMFQRLYVTPGRHDITLKLDGYRTERFDVYVQEGSTVKIQHAMAPGSGEQMNSEYARLEGRDAPEQDDDRGYRDQPDQRYPDQRYEAPREPGRGPQASDPRNDAQGTLRLNVRPDDASVYVDGTFSGSARDLARVDLPSGNHRLEIVRPGYRTYDRDVNVPSGEAVDLSVELEK
jgi:PEGA domain